ncbi:MAG TPA: hypothetical protein VFO54_04700 [Chryseosolibacter sp.]|nr:hypothetical protein [Chryseosolibacter sp.]
MLRRSLILTSLLTLIAASAIHAQTRVGTIHDNLLIRDSKRYFYGLPEDKYEGSPFLNNSFVTGYVYTGKDKFAGVPMRYNIYSDLIEFQDGGHTYLLEPDPRLVKVEIGDDVFVVRNFKYMAKKQNGFLEVLENGKMKLFAKKLINLREKNELQDVPAKYSRLPDMFYVQVESDPLIRVVTVKQLISSLPDKQEEMKQFVKAENISSKEQEDLVKFVEFYNSLFIAH